jgi:hypothetical protein
MSDQRTSSGGTVSTSTKGMYGKGLPHSGEKRDDQKDGKR